MFVHCKPIEPCLMFANKAGLALPTNIRLGSKVLARDKNSSLQQKSLNYDRKKFYRFGTRSPVGNFKKLFRRNLHHFLRTALSFDSGYANFYMKLTPVYTCCFAVNSSVVTRNWQQILLSKI